MTDKTQSPSETLLSSKIVTFIKHYWLVTVIFAVLSVLNVIGLFHYHWLFGGQDLQFHLQRIDEMYRNLIHGNVNPYIATFNLNQLGSAVMSLYPKLPLYLYAGIRLFIQNPIDSFYIGTMVTTFLSLTISFAAYRSLHRTDWLGAYIFAIAYSLSGLTITYYFLNADIGISFSLIFLPLDNCRKLSYVNHRNELDLLESCAEYPDHPECPGYFSID